MTKITTEFDKYLAVTNFKRITLFQTLFKMKFLVPTDFSDASLNAVNYAIALSKSINASVCLLHTYQLKYTDVGLFVDFDDSAREVSLAQLNDFEQKIKTEHPHLTLHTKHELGGLSEVIQDIKDDYDLVIMGTKGRTALEGVLIGSETARVIGRTSIPTLAIPACATFTPFDKLFFALDLKESLNRKEVDLIEELAEDEKILHLFHNYHDALQMSIQQEKDLEKQFRGNFSGDLVTIDVQLNTDKVEAIQDAVADAKPNLVVVKAKHRNLLQSLFHKSVTEHLSYHTTKPLLVLKG